MNPSYIEMYNNGRRAACADELYLRLGECALCPHRCRVDRNFIANLSRDTYIIIMDQYRPEYRAGECFDLKRRVTLQEHDGAVEHTVRARQH